MVGNEYAQYDFIIWSHWDSGEMMQISLVAFVFLFVFVFVFVFDMTLMLNMYSLLNHWGHWGGGERMQIVLFPPAFMEWTELET